MTRSILLLTLTSMLVLSGCGFVGSVIPTDEHISSTPPRSNTAQTPTTRQYAPKTRPYTVLGKTYYPLKSAQGYDVKGVASWYGDDFHGKLTASGDVYDMYSMTAAHKTLPLGTKVKVTNLENGKSVDLLVNDRGPFVGDRIIDLSYAAAQKLGSHNKGLAEVRVQAIGTATRSGVTASTQVPVKKPSRENYTTGGYYVQVGAFANAESARKIHSSLVLSGYSGSRINQINRDGKTLHVVQAGVFSKRSQAEEAQEMLQYKFPSCFIHS